MKSTKLLFIKDKVYKLRKNGKYRLYINDRLVRASLVENSEGWVKFEPQYTDSDKSYKVEASYRIKGKTCTVNIESTKLSWWRKLLNYVKKT